MNASEFVVNEKVNLLAELEKLLGTIESTQIPKDIGDQKSLFEKWSNEQAEELAKQIKSYKILEKREEILQRIDELEREEERLTFFDNLFRIKSAYFNKGFAVESPSKIPIEPAETEFAALYKRHFKHGKHKRDFNKPVIPSRSKIYQRESLKKIYL